MLKDQLRQSLLDDRPSSDLERWFMPLTLQHDTTSSAVPCLRVTFPHIFFGDWFEAQGKTLFETHARALLGADIAIHYLTPSVQDNVPASLTQTPPTLFPFGQQWTFTTFLCNAKHTWLLAALNDFVRHPSGRGAPIVLHGPSGTGKTHLLRATLIELTTLTGHTPYYADAGELVQSFTTAPAATIRSIQRYSGFIIDNAHMLASHTFLQEELARLVEFFSERNSPILLAGTGHILRWHFVERLVSRLQAGLWIDLPEADLDIRLRFVQSKLKASSVDASRQQALRLAQRCPALRQLTGAVHRLEVQRRLIERDLTDADFDAVLEQIDSGTTLTPQGLITLAATRYGVSVKDILSTQRVPKVVAARQLAMFLCREILGYSYPVIGRIFGGKDHSTVIHAVKKITEKRRTDKVTNTMVTELIKQCTTLNTPA